MLNHHCTCTISRDMYPLCKVHILIGHLHLPIQYVTLIGWAPMKNNWCALSGSLTLKVKLSKNFLSNFFSPNFDFLGGMEIRGMKN